MTTARIRQLVEEIVAKSQELQGLLATGGGGEVPQTVLRVKPGDPVGLAFTELQQTGGGVLLCQPGEYQTTVRGLARDPTAPLVIVTTDNSSDLPLPGEQVTREYRPGLAVFTSPKPSGGTYLGAHRSGRLRFVGVGFGPVADVSADLVRLTGDDLTTPADQPVDVGFDRVLFWGAPQRGQHRGLLLHGQRVTVEGCGFYDFCQAGRDSQAICAYNGGQDVTIDNSTLEASAENLLLGGGDSASADLIPARWTISRCRIRKDPDWKTWPGGPAAMNVKALVEFKAAIDVEIVGCELAHAWADDWAAGVAFAYKCANQGGRAPWTVTRNIHTHHCAVTDVDVLIALVGWGDGHTAAAPRITERMRDITFRHLLATDVRTHGLRLANPPDGLTLDHLTIRGPRHSFFEAWFHGGQPPGDALTWTNSVLAEGQYGAKTTSVAAGLASIAAAYQIVTFAGNVLVGAKRDAYPPTNARIATADQVAAAGVVTTDGQAPGADGAAIQQAMQS